tara:strand:- start:841 stop:1017 length:177 start_codon:yes stop_codon:yes gene_type:complete
MSGIKFGLKSVIQLYEEMLETGQIKRGGVAHERLLELKKQLKNKYRSTYYGRSLTTKY